MGGLESMQTPHRNLIGEKWVPPKKKNLKICFLFSFSVDTRSMQSHCSCPPHYLPLGLPFGSSLSPLCSSFLFGLLPPLINNHFTDVKPTLKTEKAVVVCLFFKVIHIFKYITKLIQSWNHWSGDEMRLDVKKLINWLIYWQKMNQ